MGVLNVTPDSFSDGGRYMDAAAAVDHAAAMVEQGADILDVGGESTRPGSAGVAPEEQVRRVLPVIEGIRKRLPVVISIDTTSGRVAEAAVKSGANLINDISGGIADPELLPAAGRLGVPVVLMHMKGTPATMQENPTYSDVVAEVRAYLGGRVRAAVAAGVREDRILIDPGIGFGKTVAQNLELLRRMREFLDLGRPLLIGTSRKGFIGQITGEPVPDRRLFGTAATVAWSVANGAAVVRVHDVREMAQVVRTTLAIQTGDVARGPSGPVAGGAGAQDRPS